MSIPISVVQMEPRWFGVQVGEGHLSTSHRVHVTHGFVDDLLLGDVPPEDIVRAAMHCLLDRETTTEIPEVVSLDKVEAEDHGFAPELRARLGLAGR